MIQHSRQNIKNSIEKDFYKLMNNSDFGYDFHNNLGDCQFVPIFDKLQEINILKDIITILIRKSPVLYQVI